MGSGANHIMAGIAAALALPLTVFVLQLPFVGGIAIAVALYAGVALLFAPRRMAETIRFDQIGRAQAELVASLIEDGEALVARLRTASKSLRSAPGRQTTAHLADVAQNTLDRLAAEPGKLAAIRRFLTYYLPRSAEIAEGLGTVEKQRAPDVARQAEIESMLTKLDQAFTFYADSYVRQLNQSPILSLGS